MLRAAVLFIAAIAGSVALVVAGSMLLERRFSNGEVAAAFVGLVVAIACWLLTARQRRHSRRRMRNLRDSALWGLEFAAEPCQSYVTEKIWTTRSVDRELMSEHLMHPTTKYSRPIAS